MSWSGPAVGAAPYQPPSFPNGPPGYNPQQPYQGQTAPYGQYPGGPAYPAGAPPPPPPSNRPPKKKGNPIITRYPPPPGYRGPAQAQGPFGQNQYQPPRPAYGQGPPAAPGYQAPGFQAPPSYPPNQAYPQPAYGPQQGYPQQPNYPHQPYPAPQPYQQPQQGYPPGQPYQQPPAYPAPQPYAAQQPYPQPQGWQPPSAPAPYPQNGPFAPHGPPAQDPNAVPTSTSAHSTATHNTLSAAPPETVTYDKDGKPQLNLAADDWDFDFEGAIWPKSNEPIDQNLSLGVIVWHPAKEATRALPATFEEAEEQALRPPAPKIGNGDSVSIYFTPQNAHEAFLDVRQTDDWENIQDDPVFVVFPGAKDMDLIPMEAVIAKRDRPDEPLHEADEGENKGKPDEEMYDSTWSVMDHLEQALSAQDEHVPPTAVKDPVSKKDQSQEDILASLGVTGSPKPPSNDPIPVPFSLPDYKPSTLPAKPPVAPAAQLPSRPQPSLQRAQTYGASPNTSLGPAPMRPYGSMSGPTATKPRRPPAPRERQEYDPWNPANSQNIPKHRTFDGARESPTPSHGSNHTMAGSDFGTESRPAISAEQSQDSTPTTSNNGTLERSDSSVSRKRSHADVDPTDEQIRQQNDHAKRKRSSQVAAAYSRR